MARYRRSGCDYIAARLRPMYDVPIHDVYNSSHREFVAASRVSAASRARELSGSFPPRPPLAAPCALLETSSRRRRFSNGNATVTRCSFV
jgi:hypothetical protein